MFYTLLLTCSLVAGVWGYSTGVPVVANPNVCTNMNPIHGAPAQTTTAPYTIITGGCYKPNQKITVRVKATGSEEIEGLFIQARKQSGTNMDVAVGEFSVGDPILKAVTCNSIGNSAVSHQKEEGVKERVVYWQPPSLGLTENIKFQATIVAHKATFWTFVSSDSLKLDTTCSAAPTINSVRITFATLSAIVIALSIF